MIGLAFFVYKRPEHTKKVIESIKKNSFEKIYVFQDGLKNEKDRRAWEEVSELVKGINFAETEICINDANKGLANSIIDGMNYVFEKHEMAIALEDDIVLSDGYKSLAEALFEEYKDNKKVMGICGGGLGIVVPETYTYDVYFNYRMSSVAFGTWKDRWDGFERNPKMLTEIYQNEQKRKMLVYAGTDVEKMIFSSLTGQIDTWATYWILHQINHLGYHIAPVDGYATDIGRIGDGTNTTTCTFRYDVELNGRKKEKYNLPENIFVEDDIIQETKNLMDVPENKFQNYFDVLCIWMRLYQKQLNVLDYFIDHKISRIYIYGIGNLAEFLYHDIHPCVEIAGYVVEIRSMEKYNGRKVFDMKDYEDIKERVPIVITPSYDMAFIKHFFKKCHIKNEVIMIDDIVKYVLNKGENN